MRNNSLKTATTNKRKPRTFTLTDGTIKVLDKHCKRDKRNRSRQIEYIIHNYIDRGEGN